MDGSRPASEGCVGCSAAEYSKQFDASLLAPSELAPILRPEEIRVAVIGLGYVGLPLAIEMARHFPVTGFDINGARVEALKRGRDDTLEVGEAELATATELAFTADPSGISECNVYIITVPTPIGDYRRPDLGPLLSASETVGAVLSAGNVVIYESTVYPGATEEDCVPVLERASGLTLNRDFYVGYSPERINPGDKTHRLPDVTKVISGSTPDTAIFVNSLYTRIIKAGTYVAPSIRVAEAAKVIENTQRDLNIALVNEMALIFERLGIDTADVLAAAETKWNFLSFRPGLVGGHCIGVDPYYLIHRAQAAGYHPEVMIAGRHLNEAMPTHVAARLIKAMNGRSITVKGARVLVMGLTYKENCPDVRNTKVVDLVRGLEGFGTNVDVHDGWADPGAVSAEYGLKLIAEPQRGLYDAVLLAVPHATYLEKGVRRIRDLLRPGGIFFDMKSAFPVGVSDVRM